MIQLKEAVFKGVSFLFESAETTGGNRTVKFNYPGSGAQSIEVQGKAPRAFSMSIIIPHENYYSVRDSLLRVLEDGEAGVFTHPTFGEITNVVSGEYTLSEKVSKLGRATLAVTFEQDTGTGVPVEISALPAQVAQQSSVTVAQALTDLGDGFGVSVIYPENAVAASSIVAGIPEALRRASRVAEPIAAKAAGFTREIDVFASSVNSLVQAPSDLVESIRGSFESLDDLFETPGETLGAFALLFNFDSGAPSVPQDTSGRIERESNRVQLRAAVRTAALAYAYTAAVQVQFDTTEQLDVTAAELESTYVSIITERGAPNEGQEQLDRLRVQAQASLDTARVNTRAVITIETPLRPLSVLVYEYYGSTDLVDLIAELNNVDENAFVEGTLRVLTS